MSLGGTAVRATVQIASNVVVARILGPDAYGAAAVVLALAIVLELLRNSGFAAVVLRSGDQPPEVLVTLHRMSALVGCGLGVVVAGAGGVVLWAAPAAPYGVLLLVIAIAFPLAGSVSVPIASMVRRHTMGRVVVVESIAVVVGAGTAVGLALAGVGSVAMIVQVVLLWTGVAIGVVLLRAVPRGVAAPRSAVRSMVGLARDVSVVQLVSLVARAGDRVLAAAVCGPAASGLYVQAMQLMSLPLEQIGAAVQRVAVPALAAADTETLRARYRQLIGVVSLLAWPVLAVLGALAEPVVRLLFGPEWTGSAAVLPFLVVAGAAQSLGFVAVWYFVASGRSGRQVRWALVSQPVIVVAVVIGTTWGISGMAAGYAVACVVLVVPSFLVSTRGTGLRLRDVVVPALPAASASVVAVLVAATVSAWWSQPDGPVSAVVVPGLAAALCGGVVALAFTHVRARLPGTLIPIGRRP
ncbi:oligosaccharide flippase family protein [Curtobacterium sp. PhB115]|uniref:oligosaccharide flippase family protein n=1 Tax=Curtobacterium sp. PhB115 TaxID=2485173 RepID=UPI000FAC12BE|nr:oligosaccharide flippase family protein [Curtobacterium sp. PhB115]ROP64195.1 O-antigen/teichoic acid export membrane protein [Curtobacterium sp. PhB115]